MELLALLISKIKAQEKLESLETINAESIYRIVYLATDNKELANRLQNKMLLKESELNSQ